MSFAVTFSSSSFPSSSSSSTSPSSSFSPRNKANHAPFSIQFSPPNHIHKKSPPQFLASRRSNSTSSNNTNSNIVNDPRNWSRSVYNNSLFDDQIDGDDEDEEEDDRSLDLLVRFIQNVFKKLSKRARKAVRSVLPLSIPTELVGFSVNGVLVLAFFWVLKAFLEVVCTLGSVVFASILLIRGIWSGITYLQESRYLKMNELEDDHHEWTGAEPAT